VARGELHSSHRRRRQQAAGELGREAERAGEFIEDGGQQAGEARGRNREAMELWPGVARW
jgi:hypothetical protein